MKFDVSKSERKRVRIRQKKRDQPKGDNNNDVEAINKNKEDANKYETMKAIEAISIDVIDNYQPNFHQEQIDIPEVVNEISISDDHLMKTNDLVQNCTINFDTIITEGELNANLTSLNVDEIFTSNEIPQPMNDDIIVPFLYDQPQQTGPNVIVETIPYLLPDTLGTFDENDFNTLINMNDQEISDEFLNEHDDFL